MDKRSEELKRAHREALAKNNAAKQKIKDKRQVKKPWLRLLERWREEINHVFDKEVTFASWTAKDRVLVKRLLREVTYETAEKMIVLFLKSWDRPGIPPFSFLWVERESLQAILRDQAMTRRKRIDVDEYDEVSARKQPKIGW